MMTMPNSLIRGVVSDIPEVEITADQAKALRLGVGVDLLVGARPISDRSGCLYILSSWFTALNEAIDAGDFELPTWCR
jgi:hypothetical protein